MCSEAGKIAKELAERALGLRRIAEEKAALLNRLQAELDEARKKAASLGNVGDNAKAEVGAALAEQEKYKKKVEEEVCPLKDLCPPPPQCFGSSS